jgi:hypothetical protein
MIHIPASSVEFTLGELYVTLAASAAIKDSGEAAWTFIFRHMAGERDELSEAERRQNEEALENGEPVTSKFVTAKGVSLIVRTEAEPRTSTTILLAEEDHRHQ